MRLWLLTGGNVLFGDWGRPKGSEKDKALPAFEDIASAFESDPHGSTNNQHAYSCYQAITPPLTLFSSSCLGMDRDVVEQGKV